MNNQNNQNNQNPLVRFIGKIKRSMFTNKNTNQPFEKFTILMDNPYANNEDGTPNQYYKGHLSWYDATTNQHFLVKQVDLTNVGDASRQNGFINSLKLDLGDSYQVQKL